MSTNPEIIRLAEQLATVASNVLDAEREGSWPRVSPARLALAAAYAAYMDALRSHLASG